MARKQGPMKRGNPRLEEKVRQDLSTIINHRLSDPRVTMVSVTKVELFQDNMLGNVYYSTIGSDADQRTLQRALDHARGHIQQLLGNVLTTRHTPKLTFIYDGGIEKQVRVSALLNELRAEWEEKEADEGEELEESEESEESEE